MTTTPHDLLASLRRIDWRFLLPNPRPASARLERDDPVLADALRGLGCEIVAGMTAAELVIGARAGSAASVVEIARGPLAGVAARRASRALRAAGMTVAATPLAWPRAGATTEIVPLRSRSMAAWAGRRRADGSGPSRVAIDLVARAGLLALAGGRVVVATRGRGISPLHALAAMHGAGPTDPWILLTPRFRASRHVVLLAGMRHDGPLLIVKAARIDGDPATAAEARVLDELGGLPDLDPASVPQLLAGPEAGAPVTAVVMSGIAGRRLTAAELAARREASLAEVQRWLRGLQRPHRDARVHPESVVDRLASLEAAGGGTPRAERVRQALAPLAGRRLPAVIEHGDLGDPNLIRRPGGGIGVIDWETGRPDGLPLADLAFFVGSLAATTDPGDAGDAYRAALGPAGWARAVIEDEARRAGIDHGLVRPILVATWARQVSDMARRRAPDGGQLDAADASALLAHRYMAMLDAVLELEP